MKHFQLTIALLCCFGVAYATDYYKINSFPIDGADMRDTFLIVVEYAGNTYIWNGQEATGKNYVCLEKYSSDIISGNYADNEIAIVHNQWHSYNKLFSVLCKGDGDRDSKGGYYLGGVKGNNGISFSAGQVDCEITYEDTEGIHIATKSGVGIFRFNITPNDPHGFKFYQHETNMLYPTLYVKGRNSRYMNEVEYEDLSDQFNYAQADYYEDKTNKNPKIFDWDFSLYAADNEETYPQIYLILTNESDVRISGSYLSTVANGKPWQVYCTNSSKKSSTFTFMSNNGNETILYLKYCSLTLTPVRKDERGVYTYLIDLKWIDQNNKHRMVYKELPILGQHITLSTDGQSYSHSEMFFDETVSRIENVDANDMNISISNGTISSTQQIAIYNIIGQNMTEQNGTLPQGCYIVRSGNQATKVIVR